LPASETFIYEQVKQYQNIQVEVITREKSNQDKFKTGVSINEVVRTFDGKGRVIGKLTRLLYTMGLTSTSAISNIIQCKDIKLVHAHFGVDAAYAIKACKKNRIPLIVTVHGYDITRLPKFKIFPLSWMHYFFKFNSLKNNASLFLAVSGPIREHLIRKGVPESKIKVQYIGVDVDKFNYREDPDTDVITIATVGRLTEKKGTRYLINAFDKLYHKYSNTRLLIIGDGPLKSELMEQTEHLACRNAIEFKGALPHAEVIQNLRTSHIFTLPSVTASDGDEEGLGMVILEASSTGLPVVATRSGGIVDAVVDGETGYLVEERNVEQLRQRLEILVKDKGQRVLMGRNGRRFIEQQFNIREQTKRLEQLYIDVCQKK
jgi:glycosyltransferase involved in cell wall biosynthesis